MAVIESVFRLLYEVGFLDVLIPFLLVLSLSWTVLERSKVLGEKSRNYNIILAITLGAIVVGFLSIVNVLNLITQWSALALLLATILMIILKSLGGDFSGSNLPKYISLGVVSTIAAYALGASDWIPFSIIDTIFIPLLIALLVVGGVLYLILRDPSNTTATRSTTPKSGTSNSAPQQGPALPPGVVSRGRTNF